MIAPLDPGPTAIGEDDLQAYVDGRLDAKRRREVEAYLAGHPDEVERVAAYRLQNIGLHALFDRHLVQPAPAALARPQRDLAGVTARQRRVRRAAVSLAVVFGVGAIGWWGVGLQTPSGERGATVARQPIAADSPDRPDPPRMAEPVAAVAPASLGGWLSQRLAGGRPDWPDLHAFGLALVGERMAATTSGLAVVLMYQDGAGRRLALHIALNGDGDERPIVTPPPVGEEDAALYWRSGPLLLGVVGARERSELLRIAEAVGAQIGPFGVDPSPSDADRLLPVQADTLAGAVTLTPAQAAAGELPARGTAEAAPVAGMELVAEPVPVPDEAAAVGPAAAPSPALPPPPALPAAGEQAEPEPGEPVSNLLLLRSPPAAAERARARVPPPPGGVAAVARA